MCFEAFHSRLRHSASAMEKTEDEETDYGMYDLHSGDRTNSNEKPCKKIPSWAKGDLFTK